MVKHSDKEKWVYNGYGITFDITGLCNFANGFARNFKILDVDNSSSSHIDNGEKHFFVLGESPTYGIYGSFGSPEEKLSINVSKENTKFCLSLNYNVDNSYLFDNGKKIFNFRANNKNDNFPTQFCLGSISIGLSATESGQVSLKKCL